MQRCKGGETGVGCQVTGVRPIQVSGNRCSGVGKLDTVQKCKSERSSCAKVQRWRQVGRDVRGCAKVKKWKSAKVNRKME